MFYYQIKSNIPSLTGANEAQRDEHPSPGCYLAFLCGLAGQLLIREFPKSGALLSMFNGHAHDLTFLINVDTNIFAYRLCLMDIFIREFNMGSIRIGKIFHFHVLFLLV